MRTTIDITERLLAEALRISQAKTKAMVIVPGDHSMRSNVSNHLAARGH